MILDALALYALALVFGGMVFFSFVFSPLVFMRLPSETAGPFIRQVFPWYFLAVAAFLAIAGFARVPQAPAWGAMLLVLALLGAVNRQVLMPRINRLRDRELGGDEAAGRQFARLHRLSVAINLVQMIGAGAALWPFA